MEKSKVYFCDFRAKPGTNLPEKLQRLIKKAGIGNINFDRKMTAIKIHFGEPGTCPIFGQIMQRQWQMW